MTDVVDFQEGQTHAYHSGSIVKDTPKARPFNTLGRSSAQEDVVEVSGGQITSIKSQAELVDEKVEATMRAIDASNKAQAQARQDQANAEANRLKQEALAAQARQEAEQQAAAQELEKKAQQKAAKQLEIAHKEALRRAKAKTEEMKRLKANLETEQEEIADIVSRGKQAGQRIGGTLYDQEKIDQATAALKPFVDETQSRTKKTLGLRTISADEARDKVVQAIDRADINGNLQATDGINLHNGIQKLVVAQSGDKRMPQLEDERRRAKEAEAKSLIADIRLARKLETSGTLSPDEVSAATGYSRTSRNSLRLTQLSFRQGWEAARLKADSNAARPWYAPKVN